MKDTLQAAPDIAVRRAKPRGAIRTGTIRRLSDQSRRVAGDVQELGRIAVAGAGEAAASFRGKAGRLLEAGIMRLRKAQGEVVDLVGKHPTKSMLIAMGVGVVLGYGIGRRR